MLCSGLRENRGMSGRANSGSAKETFTRFVTAINGHDVEALGAFMNSDHLFIDSLGNRVRGASNMQAGWRAYLGMCPDYWIHLDNVISERDVVLATGEAGGTIDNVTWRTPAAWKAVIRDGTVLEWRAFADNKPVYDILAARQPA
jgi:ketosteroid isomerase-like protein